MPKERGMVFPYTKRGQEDAQKYRNALSPEQEQMKKALEQSIAGQVQAIQGGINRIQKQNMMRKILGGGQVGAMRGGQVGAMRGGMPTGVGSYKKGGKVKKK